MARLPRQNAVTADDAYATQLVGWACACKALNICDVDRACANGYHSIHCPPVKTLVMTRGNISLTFVRGTNSPEIPLCLFRPCSVQVVSRRFQPGRFPVNICPRVIYGSAHE